MNVQTEVNTGVEFSKGGGTKGSKKKTAKKTKAKAKGRRGAAKRKR